jgi:hypothetical protein
MRLCSYIGRWSRRSSYRSKEGTFSDHRPCSLSVAYSRVLTLHTSSLKSEAVCPSEASISTYRTTRGEIQKPTVPIPSFDFVWSQVLRASPNKLKMQRRQITTCCCYCSTTVVQRAGRCQHGYSFPSFRLRKCLQNETVGLIALYSPFSLYEKSSLRLRFKIMSSSTSMKGKPNLFGS